MNKKIAYTLIFLILIIFSAIIDESLMADKYDATVRKIQASGVLQEEVSSHQTFFSFHSSYSLTLEKMPLIARLLFKITKKNQLQSFLETLEGIKFKVEISRNRYMFDHTVVAKITLLELPLDYRYDSTLLNNILAYAQKSPELLLGTFNLNSNEFSLTVSSIDHLFEADNNISYETKLTAASIEGLFDAVYMHELLFKLDHLFIKLFSEQTLQSRLLLNEFQLQLDQDHDESLLKLDAKTATLDFFTQEPTTMHFDELSAKQEKRMGDTLEYSSRLNVKNPFIHSSDSNISLHNFTYDIALNGIQKIPLEKLSTLLFSINSSNVLYIYDEISKEVVQLLQNSITLDINKLDLIHLTINDKFYGDTMLTLSLQAQEGNAITINSIVNVSKQLYHEFLNSVPNADLTQKFIADKNSSRFIFKIELLEDALIINDQRLLFESKEPLEVQDDTNETVDDNETLITEEDPFVE